LTKLSTPELPTPLISVGELAAAAEGATLLDVRWELGGPPGRQEYETGHIPRAAFVDLDTELASPPGSGGRHPLPAADAFQASMRAAGVSGRRAVVVYDAATSMAAARAWWLLRYFGHPEVAVLDGGLAAWVGAGHPLESGRASIEPGDFVAVAGGMPVLDAELAAGLARTGVLIDARAPERFRGEREPIDPVAGHIPGARNLPNAQLVDQSGKFLAPARLRALFEPLGVGAGVEVGAYCGSGVAGAQEVLALELAGIPAALYVGSWSEWISDPSRPVATGG
jgi:thiosulfate/3-mercaptopyruvate sulfurtransferase